MSNQFAAVTRSTPLYLGALLPVDHGSLSRRVTFRIDEILSADEISEVIYFAYETVGVVCMRQVSDLQITSHTMFIMEVAARFNEDEIFEITDAFCVSVNANYLAEHRELAKQVHFSSR